MIATYSPRIAEDLVTRLYQLAREQEIPMTQLVDRLLRQSLANFESPDKKQQMQEGSAIALD